MGTICQDPEKALVWKGTSLLFNLNTAHYPRGSAMVLYYQLSSTYFTFQSLLEHPLIVVC